MAVTIIYLVMNIVRIYAIYSFIDTFLQKKRVPDRAVFWAYVCYYVVAAFFYFYIFSPLHIIFMNLIMGFLMGLLYNVRYPKQLLATTFICLLSITSENCTAIILVLLFNTAFSVLSSQSVIFAVMGIILSVTLLFSFVKLINPLLAHQKTELPPSNWLSVFLVPASSIYILYILTNQIGNTYGFYFIIVTTLVLLIINILVFYLYRSLIKEEAVTFENISLFRQNEDYKNQALLIQTFQKELRIQQHDMKNHLSAIKELAELQQINELSEYINTLLADTKAIETGISTGNVIIDTMMNSKLYLAACQNTPIYFNIRIPGDMKINSTDLTIILGNLLDNALEACTKLPDNEREVQIGIYYEHATLSIHISNPYNIAEIDFRDGKAYTTKKDKASHGIGINRVKQTVEKYDGIFTYEVSQQDGKDIFAATVLIYL